MFDNLTLVERIFTKKGSIYEIYRNSESNSTYFKKIGTSFKGVIIEKDKIKIGQIMRILYTPISSNGNILCDYGPSIIPIGPIVNFEKFE